MGEVREALGGGGWGGSWWGRLGRLLVGEVGEALGGGGWGGSWWGRLGRLLVGEVGEALAALVGEVREIVFIFRTPILVPRTLPSSISVLLTL